MADKLERFMELLEGFPKQYDADIFKQPAAQPMVEFLGELSGYEINQLAKQYEGQEQAIKILAKFVTQLLKESSNDALAAYFARPPGAETAAEPKPMPPAAAAEIAIVKPIRKARAKAKPKPAE